MARKGPTTAAQKLFVAFVLVGTAVLCFFVGRWVSRAVRSSVQPATLAAKPSPSAIAPSLGTAVPPRAPPDSDAAVAPAPRVVRLPDMAARRRVEAAIFDASKPSTNSGVAPPPELSPQPTLAKDTIRGAMREVIPMLAECYEAGLVDGEAQELTVSASIHLFGAPEVGTLIDEDAFTLTPSVIMSPELTECLTQTLLSIQLPPLVEGSELNITYPFTFRSSDD